MRLLNIRSFEVGDGSFLDPIYDPKKVQLKHRKGQTTSQQGETRVPAACAKPSLEQGISSP